MANYYYYLRLTMHDNDFQTSLYQAGIALYGYFERENWFPCEEDLPKLLPMIQNLVNSFYLLKNYTWFSQTEKPSETIKCFDNLKIELVPGEDVPGCMEYCEDVYIAMFKYPTLDVKDPTSDGRVIMV